MRIECAICPYISEDEDDFDDTYIGDGVVAPVNIPGEDEDIFFV